MEPSQSGGAAERQGVAPSHALEKRTRALDPIAGSPPSRVAGPPPFVLCRKCSRATSQRPTYTRNRVKRRAVLFVLLATAVVLAAWRIGAPSCCRAAAGRSSG